MPPLYAASHDASLLKFYYEGKSTLLNRTRQVPILDASSYLHTIYAHVKPSPILRDGLSFLCVAKRSNIGKRLMLILEDGTVEAFSKNLSDDLGLGPYKWKHMQKENYKHNINDFKFINCSQLSKELAIANEAFNKIAVKKNEKYVQASYDVFGERNFLVLPSFSDYESTKTRKELTRAYKTFLRGTRITITRLKEPHK